ncbi:MULTISPECIES: CFI-box-CTERM domain-containing protein [unclassified Thiocapsa]|uniref:CFI-box-CTERM domain-containing protein n=1 Tax=unclassified Thiocapsa TaxID=2641286 RepID=UPI0035AE93FD
MPDDKRAQLFNEYRLTYGDSAAEYAIETFPRWRWGQTMMSGQTAHRLLNLVPKYLTTGQRFDMVKRLCEHHAIKKHLSVEIKKKSPLDALPALRAAIEDLKAITDLKYLPDHVLETATWLHDHDSTATRAVLAVIDKERQSTVLSAIDRQWPTISRLAQSTDVKSFSETFNFPTGQLRVYSTEPSICFVATAVYGDPSHEDVVALRIYRDTVLSNTTFGKGLIRLYYGIGPYAAEVLDRIPALKLPIRSLLRVLVKNFEI